MCSCFIAQQMLALALSNWVTGCFKHLLAIPFIALKYKSNSPAIWYIEQFGCNLE